MSLSEDAVFLKREHHAINRNSSLLDLWKNEMFLDVTLVCDDDQVEAHRIILSASSWLFRRMLMQKSHNHPLIYLRGVTINELKVLLEFIYSGETKVPQQYFDGVMSLARSLQIEGLTSSGTAKKCDDSAKNGFPNDEVREYAEQFPGLKQLLPVEEDLENSFENVQESSVHQEVNTLESISSQPQREENPGKNTSMEEYDKISNELYSHRRRNTDLIWYCLKCPYTHKSRAFLREHVEKYIKGFQFECNYCGRVYPRKCTLRQHKCKGKKVDVEL